MPEASAGLDAWLDYIGQQHQHTIDMGLVRFNKVLTALALQRPAPTVITIAGTNGKGSTARVTEALLCDAGLRVGTTLSPHVWRFNERIRIAGEDADDATICRAFAAIDATRGDIPLTYFEFSALAALYCMVEAKVDVAILEIGLGGRLDAFNAVDADIAVITSIGIDHQAFLGDTREAIGAEKAGILRSGQRVVLGLGMPSSVDARCDALGLHPRRWGREFESKVAVNDDQWLLERIGHEPLQMPLTSLAPHNIAVACEAVVELVELTATRVGRCIGLRMPGRMDIHQSKGRLWIHDVCHNPDGAKFFMAELARRNIAPSFFICSMLAGKDHVGFFETVKQTANGSPAWLFVGSQGDRHMSAAELAAEVGLPGAVANDMPHATRIAEQQTKEGDAIVVFGSFSAVEQCTWLAS